jgi:mRNA-degrading endonuclease RelE of RelBE toxin-antitoxin system
VVALFHAIHALRVKNTAMLKNAVEQVGSPGRRKTELQIHPIVSSVRNIRKGGERIVQPINTRKNTVIVIPIMKGAIVSCS